MSVAEATWVRRGGARYLVPAVGAFAFSPDDAMLAWAEGPRERAVHVTELATLRTVLTLEGDAVASLDWSSSAALRVLRGLGRDRTLHVHAVPDGGELARVALPGVGVGVASLDASLDGRVVLVGRLRRDLVVPNVTPPRAYLLRDDDPATLEAVATTGPVTRAEAALGVTFSHLRLAPDGASLAVVVAREDCRVVFTSTRGEVRGEAVLGGGMVERVAWVAPGRCLVVRRDDGLSVDVVATSGARVCAARIEGARGDELAFDLHPDRDRCALSLDLPLDAGRTLVREARVVDLREGAARRVTIDAFPRAASEGCDAAAWWGPDGALWWAHRTRAGQLELRSEGAPPASTPRARHELPGLAPHALAVTASPGRGVAAVHWRTRDGGASVRVRRLALVGR